MTARKELDGKPDLSLIPYCVEAEVARAMMWGEQKYGRHNYTAGHSLSQLIAAAKRHLGQCLAGEDVASDSAVHHLAHAMANCLMALHQRELGTLRDDRFKPSTKEETPMDKIWVVTAKGQYTRDGYSVGFYSSRAEAEMMAANFHARTWSPPNYVLEIREENNVSAA